MSVLTRVVISNCTMRKAAGSSIGLRDISIDGGLPLVVLRWKELVKCTPPMCPAGQLYKGRSIVDAATATDALEGKMFLVSAGLGLIAAEDLVPNYDLTVTSGSSLASLLARQGLQPQNWWTAITKECGSPVSELIANSTAYVALPASYLRMLHDDLNALAKSNVEKLRIFTSEAGHNEVPSHLSRCVMPYDERLETVTGYNGTRADFPQRALRHFVERLCGHALSLEEARDSVRESLSHQSWRSRPVRVRMSDSEIRNLLRARWKDYAGSSTRLLRYLRDDAKVACEQGRFRNLWRSLADEMEC